MADISFLSKSVPAPTDVEHLCMMAANGMISRDDVIWDSSCSRSAFNDLEWFVDIEFGTDTSQIQSASGISMVAGTGTVRFSTQDPVDPLNTLTWEQRNIAYIANYPANLLSTTHCEDPGIHYN